ncbi:hypothetical protein SAMN05216203_2100 [Marinobacter daqiaonensis]|uniref:Uncharacterized protein n=1 Tax=Marinobacter daqiaonensis TaxID=650891 RepID=A0A1I6ICM2_9GAMM|nr:hypothetical protein [Marinobacter daqiaonensis]SFR64369.1 hypothetical protein SAMN05216203_2100 [Marinobacter daqiaonensis]
MSLFSPITGKAGPATRKDLLQVQNTVGSATTDVIDELERLGFSVTGRRRDHWVVTGRSALPEFHFYSIGEMGQFARDRARFYIEPLHKEILP